MNDPINLMYNSSSNYALTDLHKQILGQIAPLWTEQADENSMDSRIWPRAAALAERTWTNPTTGWRNAEYRMLFNRDRLVKNGIAADAIEPLWCSQNEGSCPP